jgi:type IV pilus assembly protein PilY1
MKTHRNLRRIFSNRTLIALSFWFSFGSALATTTITPSNMPLANIDRALSNVALTISAEFPTADTSAYGTVGSNNNPSTQVYNSSTTYYGYFNPAACYQYVTPTPPTAITNSNTYFQPTTCTTTTPKGNFLNWASMSVLDEFRQTMTGGTRLVDTTTNTILQRSFMDTNPGNITETTVVSTDINAPLRTASTPDAGNLGVVAGTAQSTSSTVTYIYKISGMGDKMVVASTSASSPSLSITAATTAQWAMDDCQALKTQLGSSTAMCYHIRVQVCNPSAPLGVETNCTQYGSNYKPEGLMQTYNQNMRFAAFAYLNDYTGTELQQGGVLRARMKSVGPTIPTALNATTTNAYAEYSSVDGTFYTNPNPADATASTTLSGITIANSGVINYLNKFGYPSNSTITNTTGKSYKYGDPMAELYYDSLRYLRGLANDTQAMSYATSSYAQRFDGFPAIPFAGSSTTDNPASGTAGDPMISACQQNYIILLGDKNNQSCDTQIGGGGTPAGATCSGGAIPTPADTTMPYTSAPLTLSGAGSSPANTADAPDYGSSGNQYLGDMAYWAHTNDIRPDLAANRPAGDIQTVTSFSVDVMEGHNYDGTEKTQFWFTAKYGGFNLALTDQTSTTTKNNPNTFLAGSTVRAWDSDGNGIPDNWYQGDDPVALKLGLTTAFQSIVTATSSGDGAAPATSGVSVSTASENYYAGYSITNGGLGSLTACQYGVSPSTCSTTYDWNASNWLDPTVSQPVITGATMKYAGTTTTFPVTYLTNLTRQIITSSVGTGTIMTGTPFQLTNLSTAEQALMNINPTTKAVDTLGTERVAYLRGDSSNEIVKTGGIFRTRKTTKLGDIVDSGSVYVAAPNALYSGSLFSGYSTFVGNNVNRTPTIYVGANDGMLHAFDASSGKEVFAYVPNYFLQADPTTTSARANALTMPTYTHQFFVDATPMIGDVNLSGTWTTMLVGGYGAGGKGFYALNVTDPTKFTTAMNAQTNASSIFMWEISDASDASGDIGYTYNQPTTSTVSNQPLQYALIPNGSGGSEWAIIVGNGFGSTNGHAVLYFLNPATGATLYKVTVESTTGANGLATPYPMSTAFNGIVDTVWAGDLQGNMWRIKWNSTTNAWVSSALFTGSSSQPITAAPAVTQNPAVAGAWQVAFGTGEYIQRTDYNTTTQQALYSVIDTFSSTPITIANLVQQTIVSTGSPDAYGDFNRTTSSNAVVYPTNSGWYLNLPTTNGERSIVNPIIPNDTGGTLYISSFTPARACNPSTGYVNIFNVFTGAPTSIPSFGAIGMGIPWMSAVISDSNQTTIEVGGVRYGTGTTYAQPVCPAGTTNSYNGCVTTQSKPFVNGTRITWHEIR